MVERCEHPSHERDAVWADALDPFTEGGIVVPFDQMIAHDGGEPEGEVLPLLALSWQDDAESSGGETRTLNLAVNSRLLCH
jgi:hypothetical protein